MRNEKKQMKVRMKDKTRETEKVLRQKKQLEEDVRKMQEETEGLESVKRELLAL